MLKVYISISYKKKMNLAVINILLNSLTNKVDNIQDIVKKVIGTKHVFFTCN